MVSGSILTQQSTIDDQVGGGPETLSFIAALQCSGGILGAIDSSLSPVNKEPKIPPVATWQCSQLRL